MIYITADPHGDFKHIKRFAKAEGLTRDDVIVVLGDAGVNYFMNERDRQAKKLIAKIPVTLFCIHGNHEARPQSLPELYHEAKWHGGTVFVEDDVPNLLFARDGEVYELGGMRTLVIGGAYSVDKFYRLSRGWSWFPDEQPDDAVMDWLHLMGQIHGGLGYTRKEAPAWQTPGTPGGSARSSSGRSCSSTTTARPSAR